MNIIKTYLIIAKIKSTVTFVYKIKNSHKNIEFLNGILLVSASTKVIETNVSHLVKLLYRYAGIRQTQINLF